LEWQLALTLGKRDERRGTNVQGWEDGREEGMSEKDDAGIGA
jgi:hypothetical protein